MPCNIICSCGTALTIFSTRSNLSIRSTVAAFEDSTMDAKTIEKSNTFHALQLDITHNNNERADILYTVVLQGHVDASRIAIFIGYICSHMDLPGKEAPKAKFVRHELLRAQVIRASYAASQSSTERSWILKISDLRVRLPPKISSE